MRGGPIQSTRGDLVVRYSKERVQSALGVVDAIVFQLSILPERQEG